MARRVRIAVSVFFGLVAVAFCLLWVQSQFRVVCIRIVSHPRIALSSGDGYLMLAQLKSNVDAELIHYVFGETSAGYPPFTGTTIGETRFLTLPYWMPISIAAIACYLTSNRCQFSLRRLLIAMSLIAAVLGVAVWAGR